MSFTRIVEVGFVANPYGTVTWTDVTSYVDQFTTNRGRQYELGKTDAGTMSLTLDNSDGRFDPLNTSSPYYPYVLPFRPVRVRVTYNSVTYNVWRGFVASWPQSWSANGSRGQVTVQAVDGMKAVLGYTFGQRYADAVTNASPYDQLRLDGDAVNTGSDASTIFAAASVSYVASALAGGFGQAASLPGTSLAGITSSSSTAKLMPGGTGFGGAGTAEIWVQVPSIKTDSSVGMIIATVEPRIDWLQITYGATAGAARFTWKGQQGGAAAYTVTSTTVPVANTWYHIVLTSDNANATMYVNGVLDTQVAISAATIAAGVELFIGRTSSNLLRFTGTADEFATYTTVLTARDVALHYQAAITTREFPSQTSSARVSAVLDAVSWPSGLRTIATGLSTLQASGSLDGTTALTALQAAADDELGNVFIDGAGNFVFQARGTRNSPTSVATFGEGGPNMLSADDASLESTIGTWAANANCTVARDATVGLDGTASLKMTATAGGDMSARTSNALLAEPVTAGQTYTGLASFRAAATPRQVQVTLQWRTAAGVFLSTSTGTLVTDTTSGWTQAVCTDVAPPTSGEVWVVPQVKSALAAEVHNVDEISFAVGTSTTWTPGGRSGEFPYLGDLQITFDDTYIYNDVQVVQVGSSPTFIGESLDATSQTTYGLRVLQRSVALSNTADVTGQAATLLAWYKNPTARVAQISMEGVSNEALLPQMLGREIGDLVTVKRRPPNATAISLDCFIDGVAHEAVGVDQWKTTFMLTPKYANTTY